MKVSVVQNFPRGAGRARLFRPELLDKPGSSSGYQSIENDNVSTVSQRSFTSDELEENINKVGTEGAFLPFFFCVFIFLPFNHNMHLFIWLVVDLSLASCRFETAVCDTCFFFSVYFLY